MQVFRQIIYYGHLLLLPSNLQASTAPTGIFLQGHLQVQWCTAVHLSI